MNMQEYHFKKYMEAVEQENWERAEHHDKKYTRIITSKEASLLGKVLTGMVIFTVLSPWIIWWLGSR